MNIENSTNINIDNEKKEVASLIEDMGLTKKDFTIKILENLVSLEGKLNSVTTSLDDIMEELDHVRKERDEWEDAFYFIAHKITELSRMDEGDEEIISKLEGINNLVVSQHNDTVNQDQETILSNDDTDVLFDLNENHTPSEINVGQNDDFDQDNNDDDNQEDDGNNNQVSDYSENDSLETLIKIT